MKTCGNCKHYVSYSAAYEDPREPTEYGFCGLHGWNEKRVSAGDPACKDWEIANWARDAEDPDYEDWEFAGWVQDIEEASS